MPQKLIHTSFSPNFQSDDVMLARKLLFNRVAPNKLATAVQNIKTFFGKMFSVQESDIFCFSSGRSGLYYTLKSIGLSTGDEVILQAFTCVAVPAAITWTGATPVFCDIEGETYNINVDDLIKKITSRTKAIIVQHTFGIPADIEKIMTIAREKGVIVIEDCAHALGVSADNGKPLGSFGDISVFSFGRDKIVSSVFGGLVMVNKQPGETHAKILKNLQESEQNLQSAPRSFVTQQLLYLIIYAISLPIYQVFLGKLLLVLSAQIGILSKAVSKVERDGYQPPFLSYSFSPKLALLAAHQLQKLQQFSEHRKKITAIYTRELGLKLRIRPYLRIPVQVQLNPGTTKFTVLKKIQSNGIYLGNWYRGAIDPPSSSYQKFNYVACPIAENLAKNTINLPTHVSISEEDAFRVAKEVKKYLHSENGN